MAGFAKKKYLKLAKGFYGRSKNCNRVMIPRVEKSLQKAYAGRKIRPRTLRKQWISSINAGIRDFGVTNYSTFIYHLNWGNIILDRKILSQLAKNQPYSFKAVHDQVLKDYSAKLAVQQNYLIEQQQILQAQHQYKLKGVKNRRNKYSIQEMVRKNLLTGALLNKQQFNKQPKKEVKIVIPAYKYNKQIQEKQRQIRKKLSQRQDMFI